MNYNLCDKVKNLTPYDPLQGDYELRLDANESYLSLSDELLCKVTKAVKEASFNRYPDPYAVKLCNAFADYYDIDADLVTAGNGSDELIGLITGALLQKGEKILTLKPDFSMYRFYGDIYENPVLVLEKNDDLTVDVEKLIETANNEDVKMLIFSNPCNPTSLGISKDEVRDIIKNVNALVVLDEAYMDFWDESLLSEVNDYSNLIILKTCSKAIGMAALRVGFAVANKTITNALKAVKSPYNVNSISQEIAATVLSDKDFLKKCEAKLIASANYLKEEIKKFTCFEKVYDSKTNFVYIKTDKAKEIYEELLKRGIAVRCFGDALRISTDSIENNKRLIENLYDITKG